MLIETASIGKQIRCANSTALWVSTRAVMAGEYFTDHKQYRAVWICFVYNLRAYLDNDLSTSQIICHGCSEVMRSPTSDSVKDWLSYDTFADRWPISYASFVEY